jgi:GNAT-family acetyltransferase (TIGR03103 family)
MHRPSGWSGSEAITRTSWEAPPSHLTDAMADDVVIDMGWGRLIFGQTFADQRAIEDVLRDEASGARDVAMYLRDPHVLIAQNPQELFVDPSFTYRLPMHAYRARRDQIPGVVVRQVASPADTDEINRIYVRCRMVPAPGDVLWQNQQRSRHVALLVATDEDGAVLGTVTGVDHERLFGDPERGCSLWCLAVDPDCPVPGVGEALVRALVEKFQARGRRYLDLSVLHDNEPAIRLYEKLGFARVPVFAVKRKNAINERLFAGAVPDDVEHCNPYARIIAEEALRRGIRVEVLDAEGGYLRLRHGGRVVVTRESLSELTTAVAMSRCDDKRVTRKLLAGAGLSVPRGATATFDHADHELLAELGELVVKPARGEQGIGITVGVGDGAALDAALERARAVDPAVLLEERVVGEDLRVVVIDHEVVAAAVRRPATVVGTGRHTVRALIEAQSRRRASATGGESRIPIDEATEATVTAAGFELDDVLPAGRELAVRGTANLHTGGTIHDVTARLHPALVEASVAASEVLDIPVTGLDLIVADVEGPDHVFIEANERPGLANHEPQPTTERFVDLLFPATRPQPRAWRP